MKNKKHKTFSFDEHARKCDVNDFLKQMLRTVKGNPVEQEQIDLIVKAILNSLRISRADILLDLACGNGSLASLLFDMCSSYKGIDKSDYLIDIAKSNFQSRGEISFEASSAGRYVQVETQPERFTKVNCFGSLQYLTNKEVSVVLASIYQRFTNVKKVFLGNMPDRDSFPTFYKKRVPTESELNDNNTAIGKWRTKSELMLLASEAGWRVEITDMPPSFYASHYRFNAILTR